MSTETDKLRRVRSRLTRAGALAVVLYLVFSWVTAPPDPEYDGRRLSEWLASTYYYEKGVLQGGGGISREFREAVKAIGTNALPYLTSEIRKQDYFSYQKIVDRVGSIHNAWSVRSGMNRPWVSRQRAVNGFAALGEMATNAVPEILDGKPTGEMVQALNAIGPAGLPFVLSALEHGDDGTKVSALFGLQAERYDRQVAVQRWIHFATNGSPRVRLAATSLLWAAPLQFRSEVLTVLGAAEHDADEKVARMAELTRQRVSSQRSDFRGTLVP